jgi:hypothetical protein
VTRSVEIPDAAVVAAEREYEAFGATMRDALVAARPYLIPTRDAIIEAVERELRRQGVDEWYDVPRLSRQLADVLALLSTSGEAENDEAP